MAKLFVIKLMAKLLWIGIVMKLVMKLAIELMNWALWPSSWSISSSEHFSQMCPWDTQWMSVLTILTKSMLTMLIKINCCHQVFTPICKQAMDIQMLFFFCSGYRVGISAHNIQSLIKKWITMFYLRNPQWFVTRRAFDSNQLGIDSRCIEMQINGSDHCSNSFRICRVFFLLFVFWVEFNGTIACRSRSHSIKDRARGLWTKSLIVNSRKTGICRIVSLRL